MRRNNRGNLSSHIIDSEQGFENLDNTDFFDPKLRKVRIELTNHKCSGCGGRTKIRFGIYGSIVLECDSCDSKPKFACPMCANLYAKQQTVANHYDTTHELDICPFCSKLLEGSVCERLSHISSHISSNIFESVEVEIDQQEQAQMIRNFPQNEIMTKTGSMFDGSTSSVLETESIFDDNDGDDGFGLINTPEPLVDEDEVSDEDNEVDDPEEEGEDEEDEEEPELLCERKYRHYETLLEEFSFIVSSSEGYDIVVDPIQPNTSKDFGVFYDKANLNLIKFARKENLSVVGLQNLIEDLGEVYESPCNFYTAESLNQKVHLLAKKVGIQYRKLKCPKGHCVCIIPLEEGLRIPFSKEEFLDSFHVKEWEIGEDEPYLHYRQGDKFISGAKLARDQNCHNLSLICNRDSFPAYLTSNLPIKGYYVSIGNVDYPESERHVILFGFGMECTGCTGVVDDEFVKNINKLSETPFLVFHLLLKKYIRFLANFDAEIDDTPQVSSNVMSKSHNGRLFCSQCGQHEKRMIDPYTYCSCKLKELVETERLYNECEQILRNSQRGDGSLSRVEEIESRTGRSFTTSEYRKNLGHNVTVLKKPTSFFKLNEETKQNMINPPGPFHSVIKGFILHVKDGTKEKLTESQKRLVLDNWWEIKFPKGIKKPKDLWGIGGKNFDAILSVLYGFPESVKGIVPLELYIGLDNNFRCLISLLSPGFSKSILRNNRLIFMKTIPLLTKYIRINYPTTHQVFHVWDYAVPPEAESNISTTRFLDIPSPPNGPILLSVGEVNKKLLSLGPPRVWSEKKFEVKHRQFKSKMRKCYLRNPSVFLTKEYVADETLSLVYPERKWSVFTPMIRYSLRKEYIIDDSKKRAIMVYLQITDWDVSGVSFLGVRELQVRGKVFRRTHEIVCGGHCGEIDDLVLVVWDGGFGFMSSSIVVVLKRFTDKRVVFCEAESIKGKPVLKKKKLLSIIN